MKQLQPITFYVLIMFMVSANLLVNVPVLAEQQKSSGGKAQTTLKPIPNPQLDHLEKAVRDQLQEGKRLVEGQSKDKAVEPQKLAKAYGELGQLYHAYELNDAAEVCYRNALVLDPTHSEWTYSLGYLLQFTGRFSEALPIYRRLEIHRKNPQLVYLVRIRMGECYRKLNQLDKAKSQFEIAYQINPEGPAVLARLGEIALDEKQFDDAITYFTAALKNQPEANRLHYSLGMAYRGKGEMEKARLHLSQYGMVGVQPPDPVKNHLEKLVSGYRTQILAGKLAFSAKRYVEAAEAFEKAIKAEPDSVDARVNLAATLGQLHKYKEAMNRLEEALTLAPENATAHFNLGMLKANAGKSTDAITHFQFVVKKNPKDSQAHLELANVFLKEKQYESAIEHYKIAVGIEPGLTWGWLGWSSVLSATGKYVEALKVLENAYKRLPNDIPITHDLARLLATTPELELRQGKRALELAMKAFNAFGYFEYARTVAYAYAELNQCEKAVEWIEKAIAMASKTPNSAASVENLKRNLEYFKTNRPCRVPILKEKK